MNLREFKLTQAIDQAFSEPTAPAPSHAMSISYASLKALTDLAEWVKLFDGICYYDNDGVKSREGV